MSDCRKPYDAVILQEILLRDHRRTIDHSGKAYPPKHEVYIAISKDMEECGSHITPRHVHTIINNDRKGFKTLLIKKYGICMPTVIDNNDSSIPGNISTDNENLSISEPSYSRKIRLILSAENWSEMKPRKLISGQRLYWKFKEGWADVIAAKISQQCDSIHCVFSFKNNIINPTATARCYANFTGTCVECKASIKGELLKEPLKGSDVTIICRIADIVADMHTGNKKRPLRGIKRERVANQLIDGNKDAVTYRREEAKRQRFGQKEPSTLPSCAVLRKAKEQQLLKIYGLTFSNPVLNLMHQSKFGKYAGSIHSVNALQFSCIYWTPEQFQIYVARCKKDSNAVLIIDATGGIAKRNIKLDPHIFLYQCVLITTEGSIPVFQMVSADQSALQIGNFLRFILSKRAPIPPIVVSDFGWALLIATSQIFGKSTDLQDYLQKCYDVVTKSSNSLPASYIRLDVAHLISMVARWKCLKQRGVGCAVRRFYLRCLSQAYQMTDLHELSYFLESVISVSLSEYVGSSTTGLTLVAESRLQYINSVIKGTVIEDKDIQYDDDEAAENLVDDEQEGKMNVSSWKTWAQTLYNTAQSLSSEVTEGSVINACFNPSFAEQFRKQLLPYLPLWTGIMRPFFGRGSIIATSASVEAEFNDLKNRAFKGQLPMRIDKFILRHLEHLDGKIKLASNPSDQPPKKDETLNMYESSATRDIQNMDPSLSSTRDVELAADPIAELASQNDSSNRLDNFSVANIRHSTPNSSLAQSTTIDQEITIESDFKTDVNHSFDNYQPAELEIDTCSMAYGEISTSKAISIDSSNAQDVSGSADRLENLGICENWRGLGENSGAVVKFTENQPSEKTRTKPSYLDKCPEWDFVKDAKLGTIPMFRNGFLSGTIKIDSVKINLTRTCAFDSIVQLILHTISVNQTYHDHVKSCVSPIMKLALTMLQDKNLNSKHLLERAKILLSLRLFEDAVTVYTRSLKKLDAECNAAHLADELFINDPSYIKSCSCDCGYKNSRHLVTVNINVDILMNEGMQEMQKAIDDAQLMQGSCFKCKNCITEKRSYGPHILIDLSVLTDEWYVTQNKSMCHTLDSIAGTVKLENNTYMIAGAIDYQAGHYRAYAKTGLQWSLYDDTYNKRMSASPCTRIKPHLIIYAIVHKNNEMK